MMMVNRGTLRTRGGQKDDLKHIDDLIERYELVPII
jgi:hypothetical protein